MTVSGIRIGLLAAAVAVAAAPGGAAPQGTRPGDGRQTFTTYCTSCHGKDGKGDGTFAKTLRARPADLTQLSRKHKGEFPKELVAKLIDGRSTDAAHLKADMPVWGDVFSQSQSGSSPEEVKARIEGLVAYLETIQDKSTP